MLRGASLFHGKRIRNRKKKVARCARCALSALEWKSERRLVARTTEKRGREHGMEYAKFKRENLA